MNCKQLINYLLFTKRCVCCGKVIYPYQIMCDKCRKELKYINNICNVCGKPANKCECGKRIFLFKRITAPFENIGSAQKGIYGLKFAHRKYAAEYFGNRIAYCVKRDFTNVNFNFITAVPMSKKRKRKAEYNHAELLANEVGKILQIPVNFKALQKVSENKPQHSLSLKDRVKNVLGVYKAENCSGKTVLLVDDIKTTGATLNECSKQLLLNGALEVYCATALVTAKKINL